ncbi:MAG TPA: single-stranded-DNA-specific exonuclease RecJ [Bacilli bacterium]|nr:single-stranded-DNA-specific exonuclease RecJ [Bacilli bacterium]
MHTPKRWVVVEADETQVRALAEEVGVTPMFAKLLWRRGIQSVEEAQRFLYPARSGFYDPFLMKDMDKAVARIRHAIEARERIMIYGDYDADGATSTALLYLALQQLQANVEYYIPDRFSEGYGLNGPAIREAKDKGFDLVITVDNGISAVEQVAIANEVGLDLIVTDHHTPPDVLPDAYAILNPKQPGCQYPDKMLAGVGVAFKLVQALFERVPDEYLDLAAMGTVADLAPLVDENRLLTLYGLEKMNVSPSLGIQSLIEVAGLTDKKVNAGHIGFSFGPRINASGRLDSATYAVELLTTDDPIRAGELADFLEQRNKERQEIGEQIFEEAVELIEANPHWLDGRVLVVPKAGWNEGVIGIVASRLVERYYRPTLMIALNEEKAKSSARSIHGFDLYTALTRCADLLEHFGGHKMAAGFSILPERIDDLRDRMNAVAAEMLNDEDMIPKIDIDDEVDLQRLTLEQVEGLQRLAPFGFGNPSPRFALHGLDVEQTRAVGKDASHLQLRVKAGTKQLSCIAFRRSEDQPLIEQLNAIDLVGELAINEWNGRRDIQLVLGDWRAHPYQLFDKRGSRKMTWLETSKEQLTVLCYRENHLEQIVGRLLGYPWNEGKYRLFLVDDNGDWHHRGGDSEPTEHVVLYDLPTREEVLAKSLATVTPEQHVHLVQGPDDDQWVQQTADDWLPERPQFAFAYRMLREAKAVTVEQLHGLVLGKSTPASIANVLRVFTELGFVRQDGDLYHVVEGAPKQDLTASAYYQQQEKLTAELRRVREVVLASSWDTLRQRLVGWMQPRA